MLADTDATNFEPRIEDGRVSASRQALRRELLKGIGMVGLSVPVLAGCTATSSGSNANGSDFSNHPVPAGSSGAQVETADGRNASAGNSLATVAEVPLDGGIIKGDYVITQPSAGVFNAFSKTCTHVGCPVNEVADKLIKCPCHNSTFSIETGVPTGGPAKRPLVKLPVRVEGDNIVKA